MKYYVRAVNHVQAANKAQKEIQSMQVDFDGILFGDEETLETFIGLVKGTVEGINEKYPRTRNLEFNRWKHAPNSETVSISNVMYLHIYPVNKEV